MKRKPIWLESHSRRFSQQGWRKATESVSGGERGPGAYRRCVLQMDGTQAPGCGQRCNTLALSGGLSLAGCVVECDSVSRKESREKEGVVWSG